MRAGAISLLLVAVACTSAADGAALPPPPATIDVGMREYAFDNTPTVAAGRVVFKVHNAGTMAHEAILVRLPDDALPIADQLRSESRLGVETVATLRERAPGSNGVFAADLGPGRYAFICFITDPDDQSHADKGMSSELRIP